MFFFLNILLFSLVSAEELWRRDLFLGRSARPGFDSSHGVSGIAMNRRGTLFTIHAPDPSAFLGFAPPSNIPSTPFAETMARSFGIRSTPLTGVESPDQPIPSYMPQYNDLSPFSPLNRGPFFAFHGSASPSSLEWLTKHLKLTKNIESLGKTSEKISPNFEGETAFDPKSFMNPSPTRLFRF